MEMSNFLFSWVLRFIKCYLKNIWKKSGISPKHKKSRTNVE